MSITKKAQMTVMIRVNTNINSRVKELQTTNDFKQVYDDVEPAVTALSKVPCGPPKVSSDSSK